MKGQAELLIGLGVYFILIVVLFSYTFGNSVISARNVMENNLLFDGNVVETYVRSYLQALKLSVLQAVYDAGNKYADKMWQCYGGNCLSGACSMVSVLSDILDGDSSLGLKGATAYANDSYLPAYKSFADANEKGIIIPEKLGGAVGRKMESGFIYSGWAGNSFKYCDKKSFDGKECAASAKVNISRGFMPEANISTVFRQMYDAGNDMISQDKIWYGVGGDYGITQAITSSSPASCSGYSCTSGPVQTRRCNVCPTPEEVYQDNYGKSMDQTKSDIVSSIGSKIGGLGGSLSTSSYKIETAAAEKSSSITSSCNCWTGSCCGTCCSKSGCSCCRWWKYKSCTYSYYGAAKVSVNMTEISYPKYALYNPVFTTASKVGLDNLHLNYTATSGNTNLIGCSVWTG